MRFFRSGVPCDVAPASSRPPANDRSFAGAPFPTPHDGHLPAALYKRHEPKVWHRLGRMRKVQLHDQVTSNNTTRRKVVEVLRS